MARLPTLKDRLPKLASLPLASALEQAKRHVSITRAGAVAAADIARAEAALGVHLPADYCAFLSEGGAMTVEGDASYGFGQLTVFGLDELARNRDAILERFPDGNPRVVPLLLFGDEIEQGFVGVGEDGDMCWVHAKGGESSTAGSFESELVDKLGDVIVVDEDKKAGRAPRFVVGSFADAEGADAWMEALDESDAGEGALDFVGKGEDTRLEVLPIAGGKQVLVVHPAPKKFDDARGAARCLEAGAESTLTTEDRVRVVVRSKTNRGLEALERHFYDAASEIQGGLVEHDTYLESRQKKKPDDCQYVLQLDSKTVGRTIGLTGGADACRELVVAVLGLLRNKASRDWELAFEEA
ncbi:MAG: hypothetical protein JWM74_1436 [Myxococcaceae bacterium]|nr:hypothetical protein [Myxococcaceae bacterium]